MLMIILLGGNDGDVLGISTEPTAHCFTTFDSPPAIAAAALLQIAHRVYLDFACTAHDLYDG